ncbi:arrestin-C isoform X4 [Acinonyx jubatus]|uniref:Retinal cone arrestin-3 n=1 Tax=Acinonyx jubatus TaxID=32536 RepID=A0ABM3NG58_ACIJB|nr:arrestin-C isoform X4 [Acinonyx jubatus]
MANMSRVYKKTCSNGKLAIYLGKRDFVDHVDMVDPIDGVVLVDPDYLKGRKMFVMLTCAFRYGHDDLDVIGLTFRKDLYVQVQQVFPPEPTSTQGPLTVLQERLLQKLGDNAYPFTLQMVVNLPCSVTLQPGPEDAGKRLCAAGGSKSTVCTPGTRPWSLCPDHPPLPFVISAPTTPGLDGQGGSLPWQTHLCQCFYQQLHQQGHQKNQDFSRPDHRRCPVFPRQVHQDRVHSGVHSSTWNEQGAAGDPGVLQSESQLDGVWWRHPRRPDHQRCWCGAAPDPDASKAITCSEDIVIEEFARQEHRGEESQEALAAEGDEGS